MTIKKSTVREGAGCLKALQVDYENGDKLLCVFHHVAQQGEKINVEEGIYLKDKEGYTLFSLKMSDKSSSGQYLSKYENLKKNLGEYINEEIPDKKSDIIQSHDITHVDGKARTALESFTKAFFEDRRVQAEIASNKDKAQDEAAKNEKRKKIIAVHVQNYKDLQEMPDSKRIVLFLKSEIIGIGNKVVNKVSRLLSL
jgi:hypothetical protein